jgi:hypothetical protein
VEEHHVPHVSDAAAFVVDQAMVLRASGHTQSPRGQQGVADVVRGLERRARIGHRHRGAAEHPLQLLAHTERQATHGGHDLEALVTHVGENRRGHGVGHGGLSTHDAGGCEHQHERRHDARRHSPAPARCASQLTRVIGNGTTSGSPLRVPSMRALSFDAPSRP